MTEHTNTLLLTGYRLVSALIGDPRRFARAARGLPAFTRNAIDFARRDGSVAPSLRFDARKLYPCLTDRFEPGGVARGHYFHQDIWAARRIHDYASPRHYDAGSRIDGFVAHLLSFREVYVIDIRPIETSQPGLHFIRASVLDLPFADGSISSLSSLHAIEHIGLGRYGDSIDPDGSFKAMRELERVLAPGGRLYFSVPIGIERVEFDAHRVLDPRTVIGVFARLRLVEFSAVGDNGEYVEAADPEAYRDARYSCGLFLFEQPRART